MFTKHKEKFRLFYSLNSNHMLNDAIIKYYDKILILEKF